MQNIQKFPQVIRHFIKPILSVGVIIIGIAFIFDYLSYAVRAVLIVLWVGYIAIVVTVICWVGNYLYQLFGDNGSAPDEDKIRQFKED